MSLQGSSLTPDRVRRLAFIRYLYQRGLEQSRQPEPASTVALLMFHDAVELFLNLAAEHHGVGASRPNFMEYWSLLETRGVNLAEREPMRRLNDARVGVKHRGIHPSLADIEGCRARVISFFDVNSKIAFGIALDSVSMVNLIEDRVIREYLTTAESALAAGKLAEAIDAASTAFHYILKALRRGTAPPPAMPYSAFTLSDALASVSRLSHFSIAVGGRDDRSRAITEQLAESVTTSLRSMAEILDEALTVVAHGLSYNGYLNFKTYASHISESIGGQIYIHRQKDIDDPALADRCISFVVDAALRTLSRK